MLRDCTRDFHRLDVAIRSIDTLATYSCGSTLPMVWIVMIHCHEDHEWAGMVIRNAQRCPSHTVASQTPMVKRALQKRREWRNTAQAHGRSCLRPTLPAAKMMSVRVQDRSDATFLQHAAYIHSYR